MNIKKTVFAAIAVATLLGSASMAFADTGSTTASTTLSVQAQALVQQIQQLQSQINQLKGQQQTAVTAFLTTMNVGSTGDAVKVLQAILAADPSIFPNGKITGFFGSLTRRAVIAFQKKHGLPQVGNVGPKTLEQLKHEMENNPLDLEDATSSKSDAHEHRPCAIVPPGHLIAPGWLKHNDEDKPIVPPCQILPPGIFGHGSSTADHGDQDNDHGDHEHGTSTDVTAPMISNITTALASTSATVSWHTNEAASSQVLYGPTTAMGLSTSLDATLATTHSQNLTGLTASTTYYFKVQSRDASGNVASSSQQSFVTGM